jgi:murein L,D-transpeptidase YafK
MPRSFRLCVLLCVVLCAATAARAENVVETPPTAAEEAGQPSALETALAAQNFQLGAPVFIRIFKEDSSLEVWLLRSGRFELYRRYTICKWSGGLGPKRHQGDRQSPEGVYFITGGDLIVNARWHRAMNVGFPNTRDQALGLTGSGILIHGKCRSVGCFALTDGVVEEVYGIVEAALEAGQPRIAVHIFPFPLTREKLAGVANAEWSDFWQQLKRGYDLFMRDRLPPRTFVCNGQYAFQSRRAPLISLAGNRACTAVTRPERPVLAAMRAPDAAPVMVLPDSEALRAAACGPRGRSCQLVKAALRSSVPCPGKYGHCRSPQVAAMKSIDCPLKYPRCRRHGVRSRAAIASLKIKQNSR